MSHLVTLFAPPPPLSFNWKTTLTSSSGSNRRSIRRGGQSGRARIHELPNYSIIRLEQLRVCRYQLENIANPAAYLRLVQVLESIQNLKGRLAIGDEHARKRLLELGVVPHGAEAQNARVLHGRLIQRGAVGRGDLDRQGTHAIDAQVGQELRVVEEVEQLVVAVDLHVVGEHTQRVGDAHPQIGERLVAARVQLERLAVLTLDH